MKLRALYDLQMTCRLRPRVCDDYNLLVKKGKTKKTGVPSGQDI